MPHFFYNYQQLKVDINLFLLKKNNYYSFPQLLLILEK